MNDRLNSKLNARLNELKHKLSRVTQLQWIVGAAVAFVVLMAVAGKITARRSANQIAATAANAPVPADQDADVKLLNAGQLMDPDAAMMVARPAIKLTSELKKLSGTYHGQLKSRVSSDVATIQARIKTEDSKAGVVAAIEGTLTAGAAVRNFKFSAPVKLAPTPANVPPSFMMQVGTRAYWQLFYQAKSDEWVGNYYDRDARGHFVNQGLARLSR